MERDRARDYVQIKDVWPIRRTFQDDDNIIGDLLHRPTGSMASDARNSFPRILDGYAKIPVKIP